MPSFFVSRPGAAFAAVSLFTGLLWIGGCARPVGSIAGKVTYQGKVLKGGSVSFISTDSGRSYSSGIKEDGTYSIPDLSGGEYKVCVDTAALKLNDSTGPAYGKSGMPPAQPAPKTGKGAKGFAPPPDAAVPEGYTPSDPASAATASVKKKYVPIPEKYADVKTTDLTYSFKGGAETYDIDLK